MTFDWQAGGGGNDTSFRGKSRVYIVRKGEYVGALQAVKRDAVLAFNSHSNGEDMNRARPDISPPVTVGSTRPNTANPPAVLVYDGRCNGDGETIVFDTKQSGECMEGVAPTLRAMNYSGSRINGGGQLGVVQTAYALGSHASCAGDVTNTSHAAGGPVGLNISSDVAYSLRAERGQGVVQTAAYFTLTCSSNVGDSQPVPDDVIVFDVAQVTHPENRSVIAPGRPCPSISAESRLHVARMRAFGDYIEDGTASAIKARDYKDATDLVYSINNDSRCKAEENVASPLRASEDRQQQAVVDVAGTLGGVSPGGSPRWDLDTNGAYPVTFGVPRRLMPIECERLMSWSDGWSDVPDEKGRPAADSARYRVIGNGVVSTIPEWIGRRLAAALRADETVDEAA